MRFIHRLAMLGLILALASPTWADADRPQPVKQAEAGDPFEDSPEMNLPDPFDDIIEDSAMTNPLDGITADMTTVVGELNQCVTGKPTQDTQGGIVNKLDKLIEELEKQCAACRGAGGSLNPTKPLADSIIAGGPGGIGDLHAARQGGKKWGELPPHERDRILQSLTEGFPAHYQRILERYYRQLAEEKPAGEEAAAAPQQSPTPARTGDKGTLPTKENR